MIDSHFTRAELDEAAQLIAYYRDHIEQFAGWSYMIDVKAEPYRILAEQFLAAYEAVTNGELSPFPIGSCIYIERDSGAFRMIADPAFGILGDAVIMGHAPFVSSHGNRALWRLGSKFTAKRWDGEDEPHPRQEKDC